METKKQKVKLGVALSGGGVRGFGHLAALKAMNERNIIPQILSGTSAGSLAAVFYADGISPEKTLCLFKEAKLRGLMDTTLPKEGFFTTSRLCDFLAKHLKARTFEELRIPIRVIASDIEEGKARVFDRGELIPAIAASCCFPVVFAPVQIENHYYVDGGIFSNFPVSAIRDQCEILIGVNVSPVINMKYKPSIKYVIDRSINYTVKANTLKERHLCDYLIEADEFSKYSTFELDKADEIFHLGTRLATDYLDLNREKLEQDLCWSPAKRTFNKLYEWIKPSVSPKVILAN